MVDLGKRCAALTALVLSVHAPLHSASVVADDAAALEVERKLGQLAADGNELWPGFDPLAIPLAVFDGNHTFLFRHPRPGDDFEMVSSVDHAYVARGRHAKVVANSSVELNDVLTATLALSTDTKILAPEQWAATAVHEAFHVYQRQNYPSWPANEADLFTYPSDEAELLALRRLENRALHRAVQENASACWAQTALELRAKRYRSMDEVHTRYERHSELNEGLATYVELRALRRSDLDELDKGFAPEGIRHRSYASGAALALLLDRHSPGWSTQFGLDQYLDIELRRALNAATACDFSPEQWSEARQQASGDIAALAASREERLNLFTRQPGWRVIVEVADQQLLWPSGFDPLNVARVSKAQVLHTRFVRLKNAAGTVEVMDAPALTTGAGVHPLLTGISRVVVGGLPRPAVEQRHENLRIAAGPLTIELVSAEVSITGQTVLVRLP